MKMLVALSLAYSFLSLAATAITKDGDASPTGKNEEGLKDEVQNQMSSAQKMEQRNNNSSLIIESNQPTNYDGEDYDEARNKREKRVHKGPN